VSITSLRRSVRLLGENSGERHPAAGVGGEPVVGEDVVRADAVLVFEQVHGGAFRPQRGDDAGRLGVGVGGDRARLAGWVQTLEGRCRWP